MKKLSEAVYKTVKSISNQYAERSVSAYSAQAAFFIFISFFPFAIILFHFIRLFPNIDIDLSSEAGGLIPQMVITIISEAREQATASGSRTVIFVVSVLTALWSASKGIYAITLGLDSAYRIKDGRNSIVTRLRSTLYTVAFVVIIVAALGLLVFGNVLNEKASELFPDFAGLIFIIKTFRFLFLLLILIAFFTLTYKFLPNGKRKIGETLPGAVIASVGWLGFSYAYSLYIDNYNVSSSVYGSLATIVLLMLWLYSCMNILLFGALVNSWLSKGRIAPADS